MDWAFWPAIFWGPFVAGHAAWVAMRVDAWEERKARELYDRERARR